MNDIDLKEGVFKYGSSVFKIQDIEQALEAFLRHNVPNNTLNEFLAKRGLSILGDSQLIGYSSRSSALIPGNSKWLNGNVSITVKVEFTPDPEPVQEEQTALPASEEVPSALDDIRKDIKA